MILTYICSKTLGKTMNLMAFECKDASKCTLIVFLTVISNSIPHS
jgi:hypothetical protein